MKLKFNGVVEARKSGCHVCGKRTGDSKLTTMKSYILPSGITKTFRVGRTEEVSKPDAEFLLAYRYKDKQGNVKNVFEVV